MIIAEWMWGKRSCGRTSTGSARALFISAMMFAAAACSGGGGDDVIPGGVGAPPPSPPPASGPPSANISDTPTSPTAASRFLSSATFGATAEDINELMSIGYSEWFAREFAEPVDEYLPEFLEWIALADADPGIFASSGTLPNFFLPHMARGEDQLRQRLAFALSEIFVVNNQGQDGFFFRPGMNATYMDALQNGAFGNYRDLMEAVTYNPTMGQYLTYIGNQGTDPDDLGIVPDENYAREIMQLFTIGLVELNSDGTARLVNGAEVETYTNDDITELAKVFTGLYWEGVEFNNPFVGPTREQTIVPMVMNEEFHSPDAKTFLGHTIPAFTSGVESIDMALDILFEHDNLAPFVSKQLIQRFVTSNPSPAYVERVVEVFNGGEFVLPDGRTIGDGTRGNLRPVIAAILLDEEAVDPTRSDDPTFGKVREPFVRFMHWARAYDASPYDPMRERDTIFESADRPTALSQLPFESPSVFNFFRPGYVDAGSMTADAGLVAPELQITNATSVVGYANFMTDYASRVFNPNNSFRGQSRPDYSDELALIDDPEALIDRLDLELMAGRMRAATRARLRAAYDELIQRTNVSNFELVTVRTLVFMAVTSPEFIVQS